VVETLDVPLESEDGAGVPEPENGAGVSEPEVPVTDEAETPPAA
jgi:hypothetical protein